MHKSVCLTVLLISALSAAQSRSSSPFTSPAIVAKAKLTNQTATIPTTTIFTPNEDGLYRLSIYATISKADNNSQAQWLVNVNYTDDSEQSQSLGGLLYGLNNQLGMFEFYDFFLEAGPTVTFEAKAGTPITYSVTESGPPDNSAYSLYYTLERLE